MLTADVREQMIEQQVRAWDVLDERVLQILRKVPRARASRPSSSASAPTPTRRCHSLTDSTICCAPVWQDVCYRRWT